MRWSLPLGSLLGIHVHLHATFVLLLAWIGWRSWEAQGWAAVPWALLLVAAIFVCVTLHELGHCVAAKRFGVQVRRITLLPIGGVAHLGSMPDRPAQELVIAAAGPLVNVVIATLLAPAVPGWADWEAGTPFPVSWTAVLERIVQANVIMLVFNMIPAFPMDGGRMLRAILAMIMPYERATALAATLGRSAAVLLGAFGLFTSPFIAAIAVFVYLSAASEERIVHAKRLMAGHKVSEVAAAAVSRLAPEDSLMRCLEKAFAAGGEHFVVEEHGRPAGLLPKGVWLEALRRRSPDESVDGFMVRRFVCVDEDADLFDAFRRLGRLRQDIIPVVSEGRLSGLLTYELLRSRAEMEDESSSAGASRGLDLG